METDLVVVWGLRVLTRDFKSIFTTDHDSHCLLKELDPLVSTLVEFRGSCGLTPLSRVELRLGVDLYS